MLTLYRDNSLLTLRSRTGLLSHEMVIQQWLVKIQQNIKTVGTRVCVRACTCMCVCACVREHACTTQKRASLKSECHANIKYPESISVIQKICKNLGNNKQLTRCTPAEVGKNPQEMCIMNHAESRKITPFLYMRSHILALFRACTQQQWRK
jgi:hypothetical protein